MGMSDPCDFLSTNLIIEIGRSKLISVKYSRRSGWKGKGVGLRLLASSGVEGLDISRLKT